MRKLISNDNDNQELVLGLVGAIGSKINTVSNILGSILENEFNYKVVPIRVSAEILVNHPLYNQKYKDIDLNDPFKKISTFMNFGNDLRSSFSHDYLACEVIDLIIKNRKTNTHENQRVVYIINSLKHDEEVKTLRQVYGNNFFQISIFESENLRENALINDLGISPENAKELIKRDANEKQDFGQKTRATFPLGDYFIKYDDKTYAQIRASCKRFLSLIFSAPHISPTFNEYAIYLAFTSSLKSADLSRQVGAVLARNENILSTGANDVPKFGGGQYWPTYNETTGDITDKRGGRDHTRKIDPNTSSKTKIIDEIKNSIFAKIENLNTQDKHQVELILKNSSIKDITEYGRIVHAEMDAILSCARTNDSTVDTTLYVTTFPCHNCAKHIVSAGIKEVIFVEPYPKSRAFELHDDSITEHKDSTKLRFKPFIGVGPRSFLSLFSMTLGAGNEMVRKESNGDIKQWDSKISQLRMSTTLASIQAQEKLVFDAIEKCRSIDPEQIHSLIQQG